MIPLWNSGSGVVDLSRLTNDELVGALRTLQFPHGEKPAEASELDGMLHELNVHRCKLELQNRAVREMQAELDQAFRRYAELYDHLPLAYLTLTPDGRVVQANPAACDGLQCERSLLVGSQLGKFLDPFDGGRLVAHLEECCTRQAPAQTELTLRLAGGRTMVAQLNSRLTTTVDGERFLHTAITDVTALKKSARLIDTINREQETFNASISHDLRAPLITILNYAGIIATEHAGQMDEEARSMLDRISRAAGRMERTLKQLLDYGAMAREDITLERVALDQFIRNVLTEHRDAIAEANAEIANECPASEVIASRPMLGALLGNLVSNALKFVPPGDKPRLKISGKLDGDHVVVSFADGGIGIDPKHHHQIFEVFQRLHGYSRYPGTGIGLAIARRAVERMNGKIWVESAPGKGSCFCFSLHKA